MPRFSRSPHWGKARPNRRIEFSVGDAPRLGPSMPHQAHHHPWHFSRLRWVPLATFEETCDVQLLHGVSLGLISDRFGELNPCAVQVATKPKHALIMTEVKPRAEGRIFLGTIAHATQPCYLLLTGPGRLPGFRTGLASASAAASSSGLKGFVAFTRLR